MFYSKTTKGFYDPEIHGYRLIRVPDPDWQRPLITVTLGPGETLVVGDQEVTNTSDVPAQVHDVPDMSVEHPAIEISNPNCMIPADAVEITAEEHAALLAGQAGGQVISADSDGIPVLVDRPLPTADQVWLKIKAERDRRKHFGVLADGSWFHSDTDSRIQQMGLVMMGSAMPAGIQWKTMSGSFVEMTPTLAAQIFAATAELDQAVFAAAESHRAAMETSEVPSEYDFSGGWPEAFEG